MSHMRRSGHTESVGEAAYRMDEIEGSEAFRRLYEAYYPDVLAYCVRRVGRDDAPDLSAEVFAVAWRRFDIVPKGDDTLPWLHGVSYRVVSHHWRSHRRRRQLRVKLAAIPAVAVENPKHNWCSVRSTTWCFRPCRGCGPWTKRCCGFRYGRS